MGGGSDSTLPTAGVTVSYETTCRKSVLAVPHLIMTACEAEALPLTGGGLDCIDGSPYNFFIVHVMSRMEKAFAREAGARGMPYFLPLVRMTRYSGRGAGPKKRYKVFEPLFPGYVFIGVDGDGDAYWNARARVMGMPFGRVVRTITVPEGERARIKAELHNLHRGLASDYDIEPFPYLIKGQPCEITSGSLAGTQGIILDRKERSGEYRIVLQVSMLQGGASLEVDASQVEPL